MPGIVRKILLITNIPNPYRVPLFNELRIQLEREGIELLVVFGAMGYERRKFKLDMEDCHFRYIVLPTRKIRYKDREKTSFTYSGILKLIKLEKPDVIITNAFSPATFKLWLRSWFLPTPYIIWSGAIPQRGKKLSPARSLQRRFMVSRAAGFISYGSRAKEYLIDLGARSDDVSVGINTVDTEFYHEETNRIRRQQNVQDRHKTLLCITYLEPRKRVASLLYVIRELSRLRDDVRLVILGDGPDMERLKGMADSLDLAHLVSFEGFVQKQDIPRYMAQADIFLFPTEFDVWGLVLVEAMAAGLPCIASIHAGATHDLIQEGVTGFAADFDDAVSVAGKISWLLDNPEISSHIGEASAQMIKRDVSLERSVEGFVHAIMRVFNKLNNNRARLSE